MLTNNTTISKKRYFCFTGSLTLSDQNVTTSPSGANKKPSVGTPAGQDVKRRRYKKKKTKKKKKNGRNGKPGTRNGVNPDKSEFAFISLSTSNDFTFQ